MSSDPIERALGNEPPIEPSPWFAARVMGSVRASAPPPTGWRIHWASVWPGLALGSTLAPTAIGAAAVAESVPPGSAAAVLTSWLALIVVMTLLGAWWSVGFIGNRHGP